MGPPPLVQQRHSLPASLSSFVGREAEVADVQRLLARRRLVTLVGSGGAGKTRLALRVATDLLDTYADGVSFVDLSPLGEAALIPQVLARHLGGEAWVLRDQRTRHTYVPRQFIAAADVPALLPRQPIWPAEMPTDQRPHRAASPDVLMLGILYGRNSG